MLLVLTESSLHMCRLGKLWMLDAPGIFIAIWKVVSPFIDSVTKSKIEFVHGDEAIETFRAAISPEVRSALPHPAISRRAVADSLHAWMTCGPLSFKRALACAHKFVYDAAT